ncbi:hypothetical protein [Asanoa ishikariensis]|uniref:hypothetical protein n=1 Tax=Asanoa ishikariensis TaxID=137265 RepID=UPI00115F98A3|nr:hypothetical protein [Asanoa ishikariensis]
MSEQDPGVPPPDFDPLAAFPEVRAVREAAQARDWPGVEAGFGGLTDAATQLKAVKVVGGLLDRGFLEEILAANPVSALAGTLLAWRLSDDGWKIIGREWGRSVTHTRFAGFHDNLNRAEQILVDVTAREPGCTSAWIERLNTARGLNLGQAEARRRYAKIEPQCYPAQHAMTRQLSPKWNGSYEAMHTFAARCATASPPGSINGAVVAAAHLEHWQVLHRDNRTAATAYLKQPDVGQELRSAAEHSLLNPAFRPVPGWVAAAGTFAMAFSLAEDYAAAAHHFNALLVGGNLADEAPWNYLGDPATVFVDHRDRAFGR